MISSRVFCISYLMACAVLFAHSALASGQYWRLAMKDAQLRDVVCEMSAVLGTTVVLDPRVRGRITGYLRAGTGS